MITITSRVPLACDQRDTTTSSSSNESSKMSLLECFVFHWASLIPLKVTFQGKIWHEKSKFALCLWAFSKTNLIYHFNDFHHLYEPYIIHPINLFEEVFHNEIQKTLLEKTSLKN